MPRSPRIPADLVGRFARVHPRESDEPSGPGRDTWRRETYRQPRELARETAHQWFDRYPKAAYLTKVESWRVLDDGLIEFTMRRLPTAG